MAWYEGRDRIVVIGNGGGGKTTLSRALSEVTGIPCYEVDQIQYQPGWEVTPPDEVTVAMEEIFGQERWIIDGFGPWPTIEDRCERADTLIFVDHPIWVHFWWAAERQIAAVKGESRLGGPEGCPLEGATEKVFRAIGYVHEVLHPKLVELAERVRSRLDLVHIRSPEELNELLQAIRS